MALSIGLAKSLTSVLWVSLVSQENWLSGFLVSCLSCGDPSHDFACESFLATSWMALSMSATATIALASKSRSFSSVLCLRCSSRVFMDWAVSLILQQSSSARESLGSTASTWFLMSSIPRCGSASNEKPMTCRFFILLSLPQVMVDRMMSAASLSEFSMACILVSSSCTASCSSRNVCSSEGSRDPATGSGICAEAIVCAGTVVCVAANFSGVGDSGWRIVWSCVFFPNRLHAFLLNIISSPF